MANVDLAIGLWPIRKLDGSPYNGQLATGKMKNSNGATFKGDPISPEASGVMDQAAVNQEVIGVAQGFEWIDASSGVHKANYVPASTATASIEVTVTYVPVKDMVFGIQEDNLSSTLALTHINKNTDVVVASGSTTTGLSKFELDSSGTTAATAQCRILGLIKAPDNAVGSYAKWEVWLAEGAMEKAAGI